MGGGGNVGEGSPVVAGGAVGGGKVGINIFSEAARPIPVFPAVREVSAPRKTISFATFSRGAGAAMKTGKAVKAANSRRANVQLNMLGTEF